MNAKLVPLASFTHASEAHIVRARLEAEEIFAVVQDEHMAGMNYFYSNAIGGVKVLVLESELEKARELLSLQKDPLPVEESWGTCPKCESSAVSYKRNLSAWQALVTLVCLGIPFFFWNKKLSCKICKHEWQLQL